MSAAESRNAEIWSTRLQKELLALTTSGAEEHAHLLPSFITFDSHQLDIEHGICNVSFVIDVPNPNAPTIVAIPPVAATDETATTTTDATTPASPGATEGEESATTDESAATATTDSKEAAVDNGKIVVTLDVSLHRKADGSVDMSAAAYPFEKPRATLKSGYTLFPPSYVIENGIDIDIDVDWTPSLHLADAILNVGLKIKESILQGEPFYGSTQAEQEDAVDELVNSARRFGSFLSTKARGLASISAVDKGGAVPFKKKKKKKQHKATANAIAIGDEINLLEAPWVDCQGLYSCKAIRRPAFIEDAIAEANQRRQVEQQQQQQEVSSSIFDEDENDGEVPDDLNHYMRLQAGSITKVAGAGFAGAGAMFRSFTKSAKSVLEEAFLMITDSHLIELRASKLNLSSGIVTFAIPIDLMAKLKFRREESISLFFKPAPDDPLILMCPDSADAVAQIQYVLKAHGVKGKHTNAVTQRNINEALQLVQEIQAKERALEYQPSVERVNEIMDLYRQAAERFEVAGDARHEEVVVHMRKFLATPLAASILDGSFKPEPVPEPKPQDPSVIPQGEVLERTKEQIEDVDGQPDADKTQDAVFEQNIDELVKEAKEDLDSMHNSLEDGEGGDEDLDNLLKTSDGGSMDDLDAMLKSADKELADLMAS